MTTCKICENPFRPSSLFSQRSYGACGRERTRISPYQRVNYGFPYYGQCNEEFCNSNEFQTSSESCDIATLFLTHHWLSATTMFVMVHIIFSSEKKYKTYTSILAIKLGNDTFIRFGESNII
ncbi:hypothetical protein NPIL_224471 [Nephila pilipes]|uniref:Uncharacterized protein n=1 Tax=Nephila pilipes TaxID=299642 RepID=A0A8X6SZ08_NEPPI|nr:hypothetical protein NPIL_224471 [Nephila pilipes]